MTDIILATAISLTSSALIFALLSIFLKDEYGFLRIMFLILAITTIMTGSYILYLNAVANSQAAIGKLLYRYWFGILFLLAFTFVIWLMLWLERVKELINEQK